MEVRELSLHRRVWGGIRAGDAGLDLVEKEDRVSPRLPRIYELRDLLESSAARRLFLQSRQIACRNSTRAAPISRPRKRIAGLNAAAWNFLKSELEPLLKGKTQNAAATVVGQAQPSERYNHLKDAVTAISNLSRRQP